MPEPKPSPPISAPSLALFWAGFHARRNLRRRSFKLWGVAVFAGYLLLRYGGNLRPSEAAAQIILWVAPLLALFFGGGVLREEIEDQTLTYSFTRPLGRGWVYGSRVLAAMVPVSLLSLPLVLLPALEVDGVTGLRYVIAAAISVLTFTGIFALLGLLLKWSTWIGLGWLIFWEGLVSLAPGFLGRLTLHAHLRGLAGLQPPRGLLSALWEPPSIVACVVVLTAVAGLSLFVGGKIVERREIVLEK